LLTKVVLVNNEGLMCAQVDIPFTQSDKRTNFGLMKVDGHLEVP
jgi:hypothetical protein